MTARHDDREIAAALQRVLLPPDLPDIPGWALATFYEPAGDAVMVGGDFYDWFALPNGNVVFFIGDVSGKGPVAGALAMSIRKTLKGIGWATLDPLASLPILQRALADEFGEAFATLCLLELAPCRGEVRIVLAGHPAPWLRRGGRFVEVVAPVNSLLGPDLHAEWKDVHLRLEPDDLLLLFSDGLTEARLDDGSLFGEGMFQALLSSLPASLSSYETAVEVYRHLTDAATALSDDVVIGVLAFNPPPASPTVQPLLCS